MAPEVLKTVGQIAGIGGLALGILLLLYRDVIRLKVFPKLTQDQAFAVIVVLLVLVWSVAISGLGAWVWVTTMERRSHADNSEEIKTKDGLAEPSSGSMSKDGQDGQGDERFRGSVPTEPERTPFSPVPVEIDPMLASKNYEEAIGALKNIIGREPLNPEANFMLAKARSLRFIDLKSENPSAIINGFPRFICDPLDIYLASAKNKRYAATAEKVQSVAKCDFGYLWSDKNLDAISIMNRRQAESEVARELRTIDWSFN